jgi:drug/metabolite transporter (DMT)-like permease
MIPFLLILAVFMWGTSFVATKICLPYLTPAEIITARLILALPVLWIIVRVQRLSFDFFRRLWKYLLASSVILVTHLLIQVEGMKTTTATNTAWLITTIPVFIVILSYFFLKERVTLRQLIGMAIAAGGVIVLVSRGQFTSLEFIKSYGDWLVLGSAVTWSIYTILGKKLTGGASLAITTSMLTMAAIILVPASLLNSGVRVYFTLPLKVVLSLIFLGVFCMGLAFWFWAYALSHKPAGRVGIYLYLEPLSTMMVAPLVLDEPITIPLIIGALLVVFGVWLVERKNGAEKS